MGIFIPFLHGFYSLRKWYFVAILQENSITNFHLSKVLNTAFLIQQFVFRGQKGYFYTGWLHRNQLALPWMIRRCHVSTLLPPAQGHACPPPSSVMFSWLCRTNLYPFNGTMIFANLIGGHLDTSGPQPHRHEHPPALAPDGNFLRVISHRSWG